MRELSYSLALSKSRKSAMLRIEVDDQYGRRTLTLSIVKGWRKDMAVKYLMFEGNDWSIDSARTYIGLEVLKVAKDWYEGIKLVNIVKGLSVFEVHFWASKLLVNKKARRAFKVMYLSKRVDSK